MTGAVDLNQTVIQMPPNTDIAIPEGQSEVDRVIDVTSGFLKLGTFAFPSVKTALDALMAVGALVKLFTSKPEKPDPVLEKLKELETKIDQLMVQMNANFAKLEAFITEINFTERVIVPTQVLGEYLKDCLKVPCKKSYDNFEDAYKKFKPLELAYTLSKLMKNDSTNPLIKSMNADVEKSRATFDKWVTIITGVLAEFLYIEAIASGLFADSDTYNADRMLENAEKVSIDIQNTKKVYEESDAYWPAVATFLKDFLNNNKYMKPAQKAERIQEKLETILTSNAFLILVSSHYGSLRKSTAGDNKLHAFECNDGSGAVIYRSTTAPSAGKEQFDKLREKAKIFRTIQTDIMKMDIDPSYFMLMFGEVGFTLLTDRNPSFEIRPANYSNKKEELAILSDVDVVADFMGSKMVRNFTLVASLR